MKAARLYEYDPAMNVRLKIEDVPAPTIDRPDEVIVKVGAAGLCRTDLHIIEGVWRDIMDSHGALLPYIMGHENAGWVEDVGSGVTSVKPGDAVICHPLRTCGICLNCRHGHDMHCQNNLFPGLGLDGGFAEYFKTSERSLIKLNTGITPLSVAPMADAGITAYRAAKRAAKLLDPGDWALILGVGGLGHIALQVLNEMAGCRTIAVDREPGAQVLAKELGADKVLSGGPDLIEEVRQITGGGARVVIDFVGELGVENLCWKLLKNGGDLIMVGYGGTIEIPTLELVAREIRIGGSLVGDYTELVELMELNADGKVKMHQTEFALEDINTAIDDFKNRRFTGRGVIVPGAPSTRRAEERTAEAVK
ncbi:MULTISPECIES: NAD(P)-dependent alcohol dehydrogenase [Cereibacter]|uniref:NAD(P)-dependent alcohol dehydrogenase n=1 Tax=Cereibacter TaxID=1653176 RepID=UPI000DCE0B71|nr:MULTISPECIES: NAD(P)-dependent alcohol dehydrogenase [Cereibacter]RAZ83394.1 NAD(P)-dependent alcohol dehydrogenase [Cereibacter johrii]RDS94115.1 NAD(P)-dependent alcohol dehydrogenase [Cereibacter sphaeroides f. sp. denitrificans]RIA00803.1 NAD(P)-dependent alcohol dehydrogenase [Cereibacter sphaeroides]